MNVYLYQNNTEKILKNIYIGEYKRKEWDFTKYSSMSDVSNNGLIPSSLLSLVTGSGLTVANVGGTEKYGTVCFDISDKISNANIITVEVDFSISNGTYAGGVNNGVIDVSGQMYSFNEVCGNTSGNTGNTAQTILYRNSAIASQNQLMSAGNYNMITTINLSNGTINKVVSGTGSITQNATLTSEQISYIRNNEKFAYCRVGWGSYAQHFIKKLRLKIE